MWDTKRDLVVQQRKFLQGPSTRYDHHFYTRFLFLFIDYVKRVKLSLLRYHLKLFLMLYKMYNLRIDVSYRY